MELSKIPLNKDLTYIGYSTYRDKDVLFGIKRKDRRQHVYLLGKSGTGKSVLMFNMILQNIMNGEGVCLVDPHGENVEEVLAAIPEHRIKDVVYFNPADSDYHIGFNVLELENPKYKHLVASGLMGIFTKIWANAWSARMEYILNNTILALLDTPGTTMLGIQRMLVDKDYRQKIISNLKDPVIKAFWVHEYEAWQDRFRNEAIAPIQNKVGQFLSTSIIRNVVGQSKSTLNIFNIMNEGKIFLINVSKGRIGEDNSSLLGGMLITKIQLAAMERVRIPEEERKDFYLYVDEFQNFVTDSFASILSEARKYRLNLTVAHQYTAQLVTRESTAMRDSIFGNIGTMIVFRVGADDADFLEKEFMPEFTPEDIVNLPNYKVYLKLMIDGITSRPFSAKTIPPLVEGKNKEIEARVIESSRKLYCRTKEEVEDEINNWSGMSLGDDKDEKGNTELHTTICSLCKNQTQVPFKPQPGRAVYCRDCITKIKEGELKPVKVSSKQLKEDEDRFFSPLSALGIEFDQSKYSSSVIKRDKFKFSKNKDKTKKKKLGASLGLKQVLSKVFKDKKPEKIKGIQINEEENKYEKKISLEDLKKKTEDKKINPKNDRSADENSMNELKSLIEKKSVGVRLNDASAEEIEKPEEMESKSTPQPVEAFDQTYDKPLENMTPEAELTPQTRKETKSIEDESPKEKKQIREVPEDVLKKILEEEK